MTSHTVFVDGGLLKKAKDGNRLAIAEMCKIACIHFADISSLSTDGGHDDVSSFIFDALRRVGNGESPNDAFNWKQHRRGVPKGNTELRDWYVRMAVQERMRTSGEGLLAACESVQDENEAESLRLGTSTIMEICAGLTSETVLPDFPEGLFPFPRDVLNKLIRRRSG